MPILLYLVVLICAGLIINKLLSRIDDLERRVVFLEDRSAQAKYIRQLEDQEKGWAA